MLFRSSPLYLLIGYQCHEGRKPIYLVSHCLHLDFSRADPETGICVQGVNVGGDSRKHQEDSKGWVFRRVTTVSNWCVIPPGMFVSQCGRPRGFPRGDKRVGISIIYLSPTLRRPQPPGPNA